jgi:threonine dehydrogenase-like Zn-dependent dehydrogenase
VAPFAMALHAVNQARIAPGEKAVVFGVSPIGLAAIFWLKRRGLENIVAVDRSDPRLGIARLLGAGHTVNPARDDLFQGLKRIHGGGPPAFQQETVGSDVFLDMAGGSAVLADIIRLARFRSRIVLAGVHAAPVAVDMQTLLSKEMSLTSAIGHPNELPEAIQMLGEISEAEIAPYISDRFPFGAFGQAFDAANEASGGKVMVLFR